VTRDKTLEIRFRERPLGLVAYQFRDHVPPSRNPLYVLMRGNSAVPGIIKKKGCYPCLRQRERRILVVLHKEVKSVVESRANAYREEVSLKE